MRRRHVERQLTLTLNELGLAAVDGRLNLREPPEHRESLFLHAALEKEVVIKAGDTFPGADCLQTIRYAMRRLIGCNAVLRNSEVTDAGQPDSPRTPGLPAHPGNRLAERFRLLRREQCGSAAAVRVTRHVHVDYCVASRDPIVRIR